MKIFNLGEVTEEKMEEAKKLIIAHGGKINMHNNFSIKGIMGEFWSNDHDELIIKINKKPFIVGWGTIESQLAKFFR